MAPPPKYSEAQRTAIVQAVLDPEGPRVTVAEARRQAARGELEGVLPFTVPKDTAYRWVQAAKLDQAEEAAKADPRNSANAFARRVLAALAPSNEHLLAQAKAGRNIDGKLRERARTLREIVALQGATEQKTKLPGHRPQQEGSITKPPPVDLASLVNNGDAEPEPREAIAA